MTSAIPPELAGAPAAPVAELLEAEAALGRELPGLRAVLGTRRAAPGGLVTEPALARWLGYQARRRGKAEQGRCLVAAVALAAYDEGAALGDGFIVRLPLSDATKRRWTRRIDALG